MFTDRVRLKLGAGKGGNGVVAWRREKFIPKGGPCGGNGGDGGSITLQADEQLNSLDWYRNRSMIEADKGQQGGSNNKHGRNGKDLVLLVPCGTLIKDEETGELLGDLVDHGQKLLICQGGRGGRGNESFKSARNRAPNTCTEGRPGQEVSIELELKLIAEVGLVGFPNAGKTSLLKALTSVRAKVAPYPFTTLVPNLSFLSFDDYTRVYIADIPGIIEGAHHDRGLGLEFLRHIERTQLLLYVLDTSGIDGRNPWEDWLQLRMEIGEYNPELLERPGLVILNKCDVPESEEHKAHFYSHYASTFPVLEISALEESGLEPLIEMIRKKTEKKNSPTQDWDLQNTFYDPAV